MTPSPRTGKAGREEIGQARELMKTGLSPGSAIARWLAKAIMTQEKHVVAPTSSITSSRARRPSPCFRTASAGCRSCGGLRLRHTWLKRRIGRSLEEYRGEVTRWMERLDSLKQRHQMLPFYR